MGYIPSFHLNTTWINLLQCNSFGVHNAGENQFTRKKINSIDVLLMYWCIIHYGVLVYYIKTPWVSDKFYLKKKFLLIQQTKCTKLRYEIHYSFNTKIAKRIHENTNLHTLTSETIKRIHGKPDSLSKTLLIYSYQTTTSNLLS